MNAAKSDKAKRAAFGPGEYVLRLGCSGLIASAVGLPVLLLLGIAAGFAGFSTGLSGLTVALTAGVWWAMVFVSFLFARWIAALPTQRVRTASASALMVAVQFMLAQLASGWAWAILMFVGGLFVTFAFFAIRSGDYTTPE
jgi:hypothetical protein